VALLPRAPSCIGRGAYAYADHRFDSVFENRAKNNSRIFFALRINSAAAIKANFFQREKFHGEKNWRDVPAQKVIFELILRDAHGQEVDLKKNDCLEALWISPLSERSDDGFVAGRTDL
jgi:hypothetical protein